MTEIYADYTENINMHTDTHIHTEKRKAAFNLINGLELFSAPARD